jgi:hypothetical protein
MEHWTHEDRDDTASFQGAPDPFADMITQHWGKTMFIGFLTFILKKIRQASDLQTL